MSTSPAALQQQLDQALALKGERGALLRALGELAQQPAFAGLAAQWAPALYARDAAFFENFLVRHLEAPRHDALIAELLRHAEADGHDTLFQGLYRKVAREEHWDEELRVLATSSLSDDVVVRAVRRRLFRGIWFGLREHTALTLYRRNPALFGPIIAQRVRRRWWGEGRRETFGRLRAEALARGDEELAWAVFRAIADEGMWAAEVRRLIGSSLPPDGCVAALRQRHPTSVWRFDLDLLAQVVRRFGAAALPYVEEDALRWTRDERGVLLAAVRDTGDEAAYWRIFLRVADLARWNAELRALLSAPLDDAALLQALQPRLPTAQGPWWPLADDVALALYRRVPAAARALFARFVRLPISGLWAAAEAAGDEELLGLLSLRALDRATSLAWQAFPTPAEQQWRRPDAAARAELERLCAPVLARLQRLAADSPARYVRHAAAILSYLEPFDLWQFGRARGANPILAMLADAHPEAWLASTDAMRELLESPNIFVQILGLERLARGGPDAAQRTVENLRLLRAPARPGPRRHEEAGAVLPGAGGSPRPRGGRSRAPAAGRGGGCPRQAGRRP